MSKSVYRSPLGPLSYFPNGEVKLSLQLTARHFQDLSLAGEGDYEKAVVSCLNDLVDGDAFLFTQAELYYFFLLAKLESIGDKITLSVRCRHLVTDNDKSGSFHDCGVVTEVDYSLLESDVNYCPQDYKIPEVEFSIDGVKRVYQVRPMTIAQELDLLGYFQEKGLSREDLTKPENKANVLQYSVHRMLMCLHDRESGDTFQDRARREKAVKALDESSFRLLKQISDIVQSQEEFGVKHNRMTATCKSCGGRLDYVLPFQSGISI